jgi:hypothetical protein
MTTVLKKIFFTLITISLFVGFFINTTQAQSAEIIISATYSVANQAIAIDFSGQNIAPTNSAGSYTIEIRENDPSSPVVETASGNAASVNSSFGPVTETVSVDPQGVELYWIRVSWQSVNQAYAPIVGTTSIEPTEGGQSNQQGQPSIMVQEVGGTTNNGVTETVVFEITGQNLTPANGADVVLFKIQEDNAYGEEVFNQTYNVNVSNGSFAVGDTWQPTQGVLAETDIFLFSAYLGNQLSPINDDQVVYTQGVTQFVQTVNQTQSDCPEDNQNCYILLQPLGNGQNQLEAIGPAADFGGYLNTIFQIGVALAGIFGVLMIVMGGVTYMTTDSYSKKTDGKQQIIRALLGVLLALTSWLILNTLDANLTSFNLGINNVSPEDLSTTAWNNGQAAPGTNICSDPERTFTVNNIENQVLQDGDWPSDQANRSALASANIGINNGNCSSAGASGCTSVYFEGSANDPATGVVAKLIQFKEACDVATPNGTCRVVVTGGSECWAHASHGPSEMKVDIRSNTQAVQADAAGIQATNDYIQSFNGSVPGIGQFVAEGEGANENTTGAHWHVILSQ